MARLPFHNDQGRWTFLRYISYLFLFLLLRALCVYSSLTFWMFCFVLLCSSVRCTASKHSLLLWSFFFTQLIVSLSTRKLFGFMRSCLSSIGLNSLESCSWHPFLYLHHASYFLCFLLVVSVFHLIHRSICSWSLHKVIDMGII